MKNWLSRSDFLGVGVRKGHGEGWEEASRASLVVFHCRHRDPCESKSSKHPVRHRNGILRADKEASNGSKYRWMICRQIRVAKVVLDPRLTECISMIHDSLATTVPLRMDAIYATGGGSCA